uniref:Cytochrome c oxidase subunit 2 n=1 Tax=Tubulipora flabellaris TaxID=365325 RepID=F6GPJ1_9BILA|nr:cytochrome c oxidase subunit II [Tubulipora flabellaris]ACB12462.1 cytochrome c oxidase subunit II [Tubulipora flabellaris]
MSFWHKINLQESASPIMESMMIFHDHSMMVMTVILVMTLYLIAFLLNNTLVNNTLLVGHTLEALWTILPSFILILLAVPSMNLLYAMEEVKEPLLTLKVVGHQWYWSYEYADFTDLAFDSYMTIESDLAVGEPRLLETDYRVVLPVNEMVRAIITSDDVIHSWSVPSMGIKCDAVPGRLNQVQFMPNRMGLFYGQCSEICGANHSFMPICLEVISFEDFMEWM